MATNGGQIRLANKVLAEQNHSATCTSPDFLHMNKCIISGEGQTLKVHPANRRGIMIVNANGDADFLSVPEGLAGCNKLLATDGNNQLVWIDR